MTFFFFFLKREALPPFVLASKGGDISGAAWRIDCQRPPVEGNAQSFGAIKGWPLIASVPCAVEGEGADGGSVAVWAGFLHKCFARPFALVKPGPFLMVLAM